MAKRLLQFFSRGIRASILCLLLLNTAMAAPVIEGQNIEHVLGIYVGTKGLSLIENNFDKFLEMNGISANSYFMGKIEKTMEVQKLEEVLPNKKLQDVAVQVRSYFRQFFRGFTIKNEHQFQFEADGVEISGEWEKVGVKVIGNTTDELTNKKGIKLLVEGKAKALKVYIDKIRARDLKHSFLGDVGVDGYFLELSDGEKNPLTVNLEAQVFVLDNAGIDLRLGNVNTNIKDVPLKTSFRTPMVLPTVEIRINGRRAFLKTSEIEKLVRDQLPKVLEGIRETIKKTLDETLIPLARQKTTEFLSKGHVEINEMEPVGLDKGLTDINYRWGIYLGQTEALPGPILHIGLNGYVFDPKYRQDITIPSELVAQKAPKIESFRGENFDIALTLNQGLINRMLQYGQRRKYFSNMKTKSGDKLDMTIAPKLTMVGKGASNKPSTLTINTKYVVAGWQHIFVNNPIQIKMDLELEFKQTADGKFPMIVKGIDINSATVEDRYIKIFKKTVRKKMKAQVEKISKAIAGMVLSEDLPLPKELGGIPLKITKTKIDPNGHLIVFMDIALN